MIQQTSAGRRGTIDLSGLRVGTNSEGIVALPNGVGVQVILADDHGIPFGADQSLILEGIISGNLSDGIRISGEDSATHIEISASIGIDASGEPLEIAEVASC